MIRKPWNLQLERHVKNHVHTILTPPAADLGPWSIPVLLGVEVAGADDINEVGGDQPLRGVCKLEIHLRRLLVLAAPISASPDLSIYLSLPQLPTYLPTYLPIYLSIYISMGHIPLQRLRAVLNSRGSPGHVPMFGHHLFRHLGPICPVRLYLTCWLIILVLPMKWSTLMSFFKFHSWELVPIKCHLAVSPN